jgi:uncharacterized protein YqeY
LLPKELDDEELAKIVGAAVISENATSKKDMGRVITAVKTATQGAADGKRISTMVQEALNGLVPT